MSDQFNFRYDSIQGHDMGRTNETATQLIHFQQQELARFFSALRKADQEAFEDLFALAQFHIAPLAYSGTAEPQMIMLFAMLLEQHKLILHLQKVIQFLLEQQGIDSDQWLDL
jgi:hypothetical protein